MMISRAVDAGVGCIVCCGSSESDWGRVRTLAEKYPQWVIPAFGVHPLYCESISDAWYDMLEELLRLYPHAAVGEIGLDHAIDKRNDYEQYTVFCAQLKLACKLGRPVSIHCRKAWLALQNALDNCGNLAAGGVIHSWSGAPDLIKIFLRYGLSISFSGAVTDEHNRRAYRSLLDVPIDKMLVETDTPDLPPYGRKVPNEPSFIIDVVKKIADVKKLDYAFVAEKTYTNGFKLFAKS